MALTFSLSRQDVSFGAELVILTRLARWLAFRCGPRSERSRDLGEAPTRNPGRSEPFEKVGGGDGGFYSSVQDFEIAEFMRLRILTFDTVLTLDSRNLSFSNDAFNNSSVRLLESLTSHMPFCDLAFKRIGDQQQLEGYIGTVITI